MPLGICLKHIIIFSNKIAGVALYTKSRVMGVCYFMGRRSVSRKPLPEVLNVRPKLLRRGPCIEDRGQSFLDTGRPRLGNNIIIFLLSFTKV